MPDSRSFRLGDVLSITTGLLVSPAHIDGVHEILDYMTGDSLFTHQIPRAIDECAPILLAQHPQLAEIEVPEEIPADEVPAWLAKQVALYGEYLPVTPLAAGEHKVIDPITEMRMIRPNVPILAFVPSTPEETS